MSNRFDSRSKEQFINDIEICTRIEKSLMTNYVNWLNRVLGADDPKYSFTDHGADNTGKFISGVPSNDADFLLKRLGKRDKRIDIKFSRKYIDKFHLKVNQIIEYIQDDVCVVNFVGVDEKIPRFCIIPPKDLSQWMLVGQRVNMWQKECIRFPIKELTWYDTDEIKYK